MIKSILVLEYMIMKIILTSQDLIKNMVKCHLEFFKKNLFNQNPNIKQILVCIIYKNHLTKSVLIKVKIYYLKTQDSNIKLLLKKNLMDLKNPVLWAEKKKLYLYLLIYKRKELLILVLKIYRIPVNTNRYMTL